MNSIDNLREYVLTAPSVCSTTRAILVGYIDAIEREVADMVPLPVGADGVPIHVGDELETENGKRFKVRFLTLNDYQWLIDYSGWYPDKCRHHHAPTVEDVLREMLSKYDELRLGPSAFDPFELMAEYAARLRLAGDGE